MLEYSSMQKKFQIAIDGPVAAGKSLTAKRVAEKLGFVYVDTGAIYRSVTLIALRNGVDLRDETALVDLAEKIEVDVQLPKEDVVDGRQSTVLVDGEDVSWKIRLGKVNREVAHVAALSKVRKVLVRKQQAIAVGKNVIMEGRDIAEVVLPNADLKIFLTASNEARQQRYFQSRSAKKKGLSMEQVADWLKLRDETDRNRKASPLKKSEDAWLVDSSELTIEQVVDKIMGKVSEIQKNSISEGN